MGGGEKRGIGGGESLREGEGGSGGEWGDSGDRANSTRGTRPAVAGPAERMEVRLCAACSAVLLVRDGSRGDTRHAVARAAGWGRESGRD